MAMDKVGHANAFGQEHVAGVDTRLPQAAQLASGHETRFLELLTSKAFSAANDSEIDHYRQILAMKNPLGSASVNAMAVYEQGIAEFNAWLQHFEKQSPSSGDLMQFENAAIRAAKAALGIDVHADNNNDLYRIYRWIENGIQVELDRLHRAHTTGREDDRLTDLAYAARVSQAMASPWAASSKAQRASALGIAPPAWQQVSGLIGAAEQAQGLRHDMEFDMTDAVRMAAIGVIAAASGGAAAAAMTKATAGMVTAGSLNPALQSVLVAGSKATAGTTASSFVANGGNFSQALEQGVRFGAINMLTGGISDTFGSYGKFGEFVLGDVVIPGTVSTLRGQPFSHGALSGAVNWIADTYFEGVDGAMAVIRDASIEGLIAELQGGEFLPGAASGAAQGLSSEYVSKLDTMPRFAADSVLSAFVAELQGNNLMDGVLLHLSRSPNAFAAGSWAANRIEALGGSVDDQLIAANAVMALVASAGQPDAFARIFAELMTETSRERDGGVDQLQALADSVTNSLPPR